MRSLVQILGCRDSVLDTCEDSDMEILNEVFDKYLSEWHGISVTIPKIEYDRLRDSDVEHQTLLIDINTPEVRNFLDGVELEAAHQVQRWGVVGDRAKAPQDWYWLLAYLSGKALASHIAGDLDKARHHTISSAAALSQWHAHLNGQASISAGSSDVKKIVEDAFGSEAAS